MSKSQSRRRARRLAIAAGTGAGTALALAAPAAAQDFTVTTLGPDGGPGTLRAQVAESESTPGADRILFQSGLTGTIPLTEGAITVYDDLQIIGPGSAAIRIDGTDNEDRLFALGDSGDTNTVGIGGLTLQNSAQVYGGAIVSGNTDLTVQDSVLTGNLAQAGGATTELMAGH